MPARALIIAIEEYENSQYLANRLQGTNASAAAFRDWLIGTKRLDPANIQCCAGPTFQGRTIGTTRNEIKAELKKLVHSGRDNTAELYFFFSGHGFSIEDSGGKPIDVLVASDFVDLASSGDACLRLQEIQIKLWNSLGPGDHYYFIDACRTLVQEKAIEVNKLGLLFPFSELGKPTYYTLFSTAPGEAARVASGFSQALVEGLKGSGRAKAWRSGFNEMYVIFDRLSEYVKKKVQGQETIPAKDGDGNGLILKVEPIPQSTCEVKIENTYSADSFILQVSAYGLTQQFPFQGNSYTLSLAPNDYTLRVSHPTAAVRHIDPPLLESGLLDLYDPCVVRFEKLMEPPSIEEAVVRLDKPKRILALFPAPKMAIVALKGAPHTEIILENPQTGFIASSPGGFVDKVAPGTYLLQVQERGITIQQRTLTVKPGERKRVTLLNRPKGKVRANIIKKVAGGGRARIAEFSESLGPIANWDLGLWLSLLGASRIIASPGEFGKFASVPLGPLQHVSPGQSAFYVLAGFEQVRGSFGISLGRGPAIKWATMRRVKGLAGMYEFHASTAPGPALLSIKIPTRVPITLATYCLPNRATLITVSEAVDDKLGDVRIHQFILPIYSLVSYLDPRVLSYLDQNPLGRVRTMFLAQSQFALKRSVEPKAGDTEIEGWRALLSGQWLDPVLSSITSYELIRRGRLHGAREYLQGYVRNCRQYFEGMPDIEVIAGLVGMESHLPGAPPLMLDGVLAWEELQDRLPLSADKLDYDSPWTLWRGAVQD